MKWFLITLAIGLAASDKLDRTYLPPPGAQFSGGNLGDLDVPLAPPHHSHSGPGDTGHEGPQTNFGLNGERVDIGDKIPKVPFNSYPEQVPTTTTSFAFSQTTTYPPAESYETTALPINPVTGLPFQLDQASYPYGPSQGQQNIENLPSYTQNQGQGAPTYGTNIQPSLVSQSPTSGPVIYDRTNYGQPSSQYPGQNVITPESTGNIPGSVYQVPVQNQGQIQYPGVQSNTEQQGILPNGDPGNQRFDQYPGQNVVSPGDTFQIPGGNQGLTQYPGGQKITGQQGFVPSTASPTNLGPGANQYGTNYVGSQGQIPQDPYPGQPINVQSLGEPQPSQTSNQNQKPFNVGGISSQYPIGNQNLISGPQGPENVYQPGSTLSTIPSSYYNGVSSTTPIPGVPSSTTAYSSVRPVYRPERPQAAADRNAVILNYENVRTPNGYSYSFDTSNGIHADESGIEDNGTKAQGSYSYTGDDGKVYSVIYTADENGFQPRGDHLPTPPPIPEAIKRVIEQAARDKAAGIIDDGSYDEAKYGDKKYQVTAHRRRPQNQGANRLGNKRFNGALDDQIKPIAGIHDAEYDEGIPQDQFRNKLPMTGTRKNPSGIIPNQVNGVNNAQDNSEGNRRISGEDGKILGIKKQVSSGLRPMSIDDNLPYTAAKDSDQKNQFGLQNRGPSGRRPTSGVKTMQTEYPGTQIDEDGTGDYSNTNGNGFGDSENQDIDSVSPSLSDGTSKNIINNFDSVTGNTQVPIIGNRKQSLRQRVKGNNQNTNDRPQSENFIQKSTDKPSISEYITNSANQPIPNQQGTRQDDTGYHYQQPNPKFEQTKFPTRFSPQEVSSTMNPDQRRTENVKGITRKPFMTPNVYNQNDEPRQSTTRRPFMTVGVTSPTDSSYTDYDDGDDYATDQDVDDGRNDSTRGPAKKTGIISQPNQLTQTTSRPQYTPDGYRTRVTQKGTVTPGYKTENSGTITPGYKYGSTTPMPSHSSRFGSTETTRKMNPKQRRPSNTVPDSTSAVGRPVTSESPSGTTIADSNYQTAGPVSEYSGTNVVPGYPATGTGAPQGYPTSKYRPSQGYSSTTAIPPSSVYKQGSGSLIPSQTPAPQPSPTGTFHTGYHYGPPRTDYSTTVSPISERTGPDFFTPSGIPGVYPTSPPGNYETTNYQGFNGFPSTTAVPSTPRRQGTFILSQPGNTAPESLPNGNYQGNFQNGPSTSDYSTTIMSSTPGGTPVFGYQGSSGPSIPQVTTGYEYGPSKPTYSPTTIGTTPGSFVPSGTPVAPTQGYSTTYPPGFQTIKDIFVSGPLVDGFGRPITTEQGGSHPGFSHPVQGATGPKFGGTEQSTAYPGTYDQSRVIGEDFSGPKQPQRYDPKTGYHYK